MTDINLNVWKIKRCSNCTFFINDNTVIDLMFNEGICMFKTKEENALLGMKVIRRMNNPACEFFKNKHYNNE